MRQLGQVLGVAVLGTLVFAGVGSEAGARRLDPAHAQAFVNGIHDAMWVSGLALLAGAVLTALLVPGGLGNKPIS
jgi:hypothetical protein